MTRNSINVYVPNLRTECREGRLRSIRSLPSTMETENRERHEDVSSLGLSGLEHERRDSAMGCELIPFPGTCEPVHAKIRCSRYSPSDQLGAPHPKCDGAKRDMVSYTAFLHAATCRLPLSQETKRTKIVFFGRHCLSGCTTLTFGLRFFALKAKRQSRAGCTRA